MIDTLDWLTWDRPYRQMAKRQRWFRKNIDTPPPPRIALTEFDLASQVIFNARITEWCAHNQYLRELAPGTSYVAIVPKNTGSLNHIIMMTSFRGLAKRSALDAWVETIADVNDDQALDQLISYIPTLLTEVDPHYVDLYINRLYRGLDAVRDPSDDLRWDTIHTELPFLWFMYAIQQKMQSYTPSVRSPE